MRRHKRRFSGKLAQPLFQRERRGPIVWLTNRGPAENFIRELAILREIEARTDERLHLLLDQYEIPRRKADKWQILALALAKDYVPGFRIEGLPGARKKWGRSQLIQLYQSVCALVADGMSAMEACRRLVVAPAADQRFPKCNSPRTLYRRYQEAKRSLK